MKVLRTCGEAVAVWRSGPPVKKKREVCASCDGDGIVTSADGFPRWCPACGGMNEPDETRAAQEAARRARAVIRRYCTHNRLSRLVTLTWRGEGCHDYDEMVRAVHAFVEALAYRLQRPIPYLWVPELHKTGHGYHVHVAIGQYIAKDVLAECWAHGFVDVRLLRGPSGQHLKGEKAARRAAGYLAKYIGKSTEGTVPKGRHRYDRARRDEYNPPVIECLAPTMEAAREWMRDVLGCQPDQVWSSNDLPDGEWCGPPVVMFATALV